MGVYAQRAVLADPLVFSSCLFVVYWCVYSTPPKNLLLPICPPVCLSGIANCGFLPFLSNTSSLTNGTAGCRPFITEMKDVTRRRYPPLPTFKRCTILCEAFEIIAEKYDEKQAELVCFFPLPSPHTLPLRSVLRRSRWEPVQPRTGGSQPSVADRMQPFCTFLGGWLWQISAPDKCTEFSLDARRIITYYRLL